MDLDKKKRLESLAKQIAKAVWDASDQSGIGVLWGEPRLIETPDSMKVEFGIGRGRVIVLPHNKNGGILCVYSNAGGTPIVDLEFETIAIFERDIKEVMEYTTDAIFPKEEAA